MAPTLRIEIRVSFSIPVIFTDLSLDPSETKDLMTLADALKQSCNSADPALELLSVRVRLGKADRVKMHEDSQ